MASSESVALTPRMLTAVPNRAQPSGPFVLTAGDGHGAIVYASHLAARERSDHEARQEVAGALESQAPE